MPKVLSMVQVQRLTPMPAVLFMVCHGVLPVLFSRHCFHYARCTDYSIRGSPLSILLSLLATSDIHTEFDPCLT